jgi:hypothetical protein
VTFGVADEPVWQTTIATTPDGVLMVVYRGARSDRVYYQQSLNGGDTWSSPLIIPGVRARDGNDPPLDRYSMAVDSAGHFHLVMVGFPSSRTSQVPQLLHLTWDGTAWSAPEQITSAALYPEWPKIVVGSGNQLHVVWFSRLELFNDSLRQVWYSTRGVDTPKIAPVADADPKPTPTAKLTTGEAPAQVVNAPPSRRLTDIPPPESEIARAPWLIALVAIVPAGLLIGMVYLMAKQGREK